jgi:hypothetical protein
MSISEQLTFMFGILVIGVALGLIMEKAACDYDYSLKGANFSTHPKAIYNECNEKNTFRDYSMTDTMAVCYDI